jgi:hypothetical protein
MTFMASGALAGSFTAVIYVALLLFFSRRWGLSEFWEAVYVAHHLFGKKPKEED